ncbi:DinB family protein [Echinicola strongylocentroti]|uniref:DinB family protein n=1 Tax=Echinicola strongylocentroti TaxID=1795355 RepID=A0A2Z4IL74_9BACT|nr:DinB family protein [Echinicola strongylocentroti]AWW31695.1 DinB family protein [Echinicola strongylocentroti]
MNINSTIKTRENFIHLINGMTLAELNEIPTGFNNNIVWNFGHVIVTQQLLCYKLSGQDMLVSGELVEKYRKGTKPEAPATSKEIEELKILALSTLESFKNDFMAGHFKEFNEYTTSFGATLRNISEAVEFNSIHEGMHLGYAMAQRKAVRA